VAVHATGSVCAGMFCSVCTTRDDVSPIVSMASWDLSNSWGEVC
jgi:hypothetical protein